MIRQLTIHLVLCALGFTLYTGNIQAQQTAPVNRQPVFAGSFYPGSKQALESALKELYAASSP
ncbi:MAG: hypothetical protein KAT15_11610, partial [Bacteroidales bacterium]|nr:hypothetical protein [Bacteroidales bacterium]